MPDLSQSEPLWLVSFKANSLYRIDEAVRMIQKALEKLPNEAFWQRPNSASNAVGHLLLHLGGNLRQYVISGLGGAPDTRQRDLEFTPESEPDREETWKGFIDTVMQVKQIIDACPESEYLRERTVQGFHLSGIGMVLHAVEHLSYHTGQIAYAVKAMENTDLGFYDGVDLNTKND